MAQYLYVSLLNRSNTGQNFPYYREKKTGKNVMFKNEFGDPVPRGPFISENTKMLDDSKEDEAILIEYLSNHPFRNQNFELRDLTKERNTRMNQEKLIAQMTRKIMMLSKKEAPGFFSFFDMDDFDDVARTKLIRQLDDPKVLKRVQDAMNIKNLDIIVSIRHMIKWGVIVQENGEYRAAHSGAMLGLDEQSVAEQLEKQPDVYKEMQKISKRKEVEHKEHEKRTMEDLTLDPEKASEQNQ